ncbi:hypothetical protein [Alkalicoccus daliensis]|uniref:Uncharacterized protein n=1 Tax=Alkalicoccus daliensis TaxID=745820 RepID=A0A1H0K0A4_9BACI|nr:hypothetical protein [Alkalicoccus daliensis]SDO49111.1 hypothetical protein SAMN04488053_11549 [Alkalicoccus daliensis]
MKPSMRHHPSESLSVTLPYQTKQDLIDIFMKSCVAKKEYLEPLNTLALRDGLLELFSRDEYGCFFTEHGEWRPHIMEMTEEERNLYLYYHVKRNAEEFWEDEPEVAAEFIESQLPILSYSELPASFTAKLYCTTLKKLINQREWEQFLSVFGPSVGTPHYSFLFKV